MTTNVGMIDRVLRIAVAAVLVWAAFGTELAANGVVQWVLPVIAAIFALTAVVGTCPLYSIIGMKTCGKS